MARGCEVCNKKASLGNMYAHRGLAKYKGGVGIKTTGKTRRQFRPNLQIIQLEGREGARYRGRVCTKCLKSGVVKKPLRRDIPEGLLARMRAKEEAKSPEARKKAAGVRAERRRARKAGMRAKVAAKAAAKSGAKPAPKGAPVKGAAPAAPPKGAPKKK
jgi:large subunit ribosomal protein L28